MPMLFLPLTATIQPMDWSATAAWIALAISIVGTIAAPLITSALNNHHQLKLRKLEMEQRAIETLESRRFNSINNFLAHVGHCLYNADLGAIKSCGESFFCVYQYVPTEMWPELDKLYKQITSFERENAIETFRPIVHKLTEILKEAPQVTP